MIDLRVHNSSVTVPEDDTFFIWAEESSDLNPNTLDGYQWAFGNGDNTPVNSGLVLLENCQLIALGLNIVGSGVASVKAIKNGSETGKIVAVETGTKTGFTNFDDNPIDYARGDILNFRTATGSSSSNKARVTAMFKRVIG